MSDSNSPDCQRIRQHLVATIRQRTGRRYHNLEKALERMEFPELVDLRHALNDLEAEKTNAVRRATMQPWRR